ncbi:MAG: hypothetical protein GAK43_01532 [Stenotrophomonas maltophilia]|nr:MAG: hypothetical protein GAK43_01532 [Stenotrophomonas maltophilia]
MESHSKHIGQVPAHLVREAAPRKHGRAWRAEYNIAVWLQVATEAAGDVSLRVTYRDGEQTRVHLVDQARAATHNQRVLLCGVAGLEFSQAIGEMSLTLVSAQPIRALRLDEVFVQAVDVRADDGQRLVR